MYDLSSVFGGKAGHGMLVIRQIIQTFDTFRQMRKEKRKLSIFSIVYIF